MRTPVDMSTEVRAVPLHSVSLTVARGIETLEGRAFAVLPLGEARLGRSPECEIHLPEQGVSRVHAKLVWEGERLFLEHCSATNPTFVNRQPLTGRRELFGGEEIQLADRVALRLDWAGRRAPSGRASLREKMEEKLRRDREIEEHFSRTGSFLDVDVVDSLGLKRSAIQPEHIVVSFERFHAFVAGLVEDHDGIVINSLADEVMCFFEAPLQAVRAASALIEALELFNAEQNLVGRPFAVRMGIHTGSSLIDRAEGIAYSPVLDVAGHLQKLAGTNQLLVSEETYRALPEGLPFEPAGRGERDDIEIYRLRGPLDGGPGA